MTNYELYVTESKKLKAAIGSINKAVGRTEAGEYDSQNDKHELVFSIGEMGYGYYGSSSYYTIENPIAKQYLKAACQVSSSTLASTAIRLITNRLDELRKAAEAEAKSVLQEVAQ